MANDLKTYEGQQKAFDDAIATSGDVDTQAAIKAYRGALKTGRVPPKIGELVRLGTITTKQGKDLNTFMQTRAGDELERLTKIKIEPQPVNAPAEPDTAKTNAPKADAAKADTPNATAPEAEAAAKDAENIATQGGMRLKRSEMIKAAGPEGGKLLTKYFDDLKAGEKIPSVEDWLATQKDVPENGKEELTKFLATDAAKPLRDVAGQNALPTASGDAQNQEQTEGQGAGGGLPQWFQANSGAASIGLGILAAAALAFMGLPPIFALLIGLLIGGVANMFGGAGSFVNQTFFNSGEQEKKEGDGPAQTVESPAAGKDKEKAAEPNSAQNAEFLNSLDVAKKDEKSKWEVKTDASGNEVIIRTDSASKNEANIKKMADELNKQMPLENGKQNNVFSVTKIGEEYFLATSNRRLNKQPDSGRDSLTELNKTEKYNKRSKTLADTLNSMTLTNPFPTTPPLKPAEVWKTAPSSDGRDAIIYTFAEFGTKEDALEQAKLYNSRIAAANASKQENEIFYVKEVEGKWYVATSAQRLDKDGGLKALNTAETMEKLTRIPATTQAVPAQGATVTAPSAPAQTPAPAPAQQQATPAAPAGTEPTQVVGGTTVTAPSAPAQNLPFQNPNGPMLNRP